MPQSSNPGDHLVSVILDFGADAARFEPAGFTLDDQGMTLLAPWCFEEGACLMVRVTSASQGAVDVEAMVVRCVPDEGRYQITVLFLDEVERRCGCRVHKENSEGETPLFPFSAN